MILFLGFSQNQSQSSQIDLNDDGDWYSGSIKSITLQNFMCHSNFHLKLNPRINFISGLNGSGKSAIQTAIVVGFGGRASVTDRGSSLKTLIKFGCPSATISITIANTRSIAIGPFKPEVYGKQITIVRTISESGSNPFKILDENGKVVKGFKNELKNLTLHFNIFVDNPVCVMNQNMVKKFHKCADPNDKYNLFYKAISADVYNDKIEETILIAREHSEKLTETRAVLKQCEKDMNEYETYEKKSNDLDNLKKDIKRFQDENAWCLVSDYEKTYEEYLHQMESFKNSLLQGTEKKNLLEEKIHTLSEKLKVKNEELINAEQTRSQNHLLLVDVKKKLDAKAAELDSIKQVNKKHKFNLKLLYNDKKESERLIEVERQKGNTKTYAQYKEMLEQCEQSIAEIDAALKTNIEHEKAISNTVDDLKQNIISLKNNEITPCQRRVGELNRNISSMLQQQDTISFYGNWMPKLIETINDLYRQNKFKKKPIGPIGAYIKVNDDKWIFSIENNLGRNTLNTFLVDNFEDNKVLKSVMNKIIPGNIKNPSIITSKFFDRVHNISAKETQNSFFRMLTFTSPMVANCLIDNNRIESIMLVDSNKEAMSLMENPSTVPRCCSYSLTLDCTQIYPSPSYRVYALQNKVEPIFLQSDLSVSVNNLKREKAELEVKIDKLNREFEKIERSRLEKNQYLDKTKSETKLLKTKYDEYLKKINIIRAKCDEENDDRLTFVTDELNEINLKITKVTTLLEESKDSLERCSMELEIIQENFHKIKSTIDNADRDLIYNAIAAIEDEMKKLKTELLRINNNAGNEKQALANLVEKVETCKNTLEQYTKDAEAISPRIKVTRRSEDITKDMNEADRKFKLLDLELKKCGETHLVLKEGYIRKKQEYLSQLSLYELVENIYEDNTKVMRTSKKALKTYISDISIKVMEAFDYVLTVRKLKGNLNVDCEEKSMVITMYNAISTSCASGGERTFATVALILALWSNVELPFFSIDEYDVFMDNVNRMATNDLLMVMIANRKNQFIFLTPQDISHIQSGPKVKVVKLKEPRT